MRRSIIKLVAVSIMFAAPILTKGLSLIQLGSLWDGLTLVAIVSNLAVWYGVSLEGEHNSEDVKRRGARIVVAFLLIETWAGWALWYTDDAISNKKDAQIAALQTAGAPRNVPDTDLQKVTAALRTVKPCALDIWISESGNTQESLRLGRIFLNALSKAQFHPDIIAGVGIPEPGLAVFVIDRANTGKNLPVTQANALLGAVKNTGLQTKPNVETIDGGPYGSLYFAHREDDKRKDLESLQHALVLFIGPKPETN